MTEDTYREVMQGMDSLRFLEGMLCTVLYGNKPIQQFDLDDLTGYIQLLLGHTHAPLKALEYQNWQPVPKGQPLTPAPAAQAVPPAEPVELDPAEDEELLLSHYRRLPAGERQYLRRCAEALASVAEQEAKP
ncbi:TPA: hypothetical protein NIE31_006270 [Pseudomonas aeruginosa]|nr:hypothetical protein [Pseudomonas aeruginosa]